MGGSGACRGMWQGCSVGKTEQQQEYGQANRLVSIFCFRFPWLMSRARTKQNTSVGVQLMF